MIYTSEMSGRKPYQGLTVHKHPTPVKSTQQKSPAATPKPGAHAPPVNSAPSPKARAPPRDLRSDIEQVKVKHDEIYKTQSPTVLPGTQMSSMTISSPVSNRLSQDAFQQAMQKSGTDYLALLTATLRSQGMDEDTVQIQIERTRLALMGPQGLDPPNVTEECEDVTMALDTSGLSCGDCQIPFSDSVNPEESLFDNIQEVDDRSRYDDDEELPEDDAELEDNDDDEEYAPPESAVKRPTRQRKRPAHLSSCAETGDGFTSPTKRQACNTSQSFLPRAVERNANRVQSRTAVQLKPAPLLPIVDISKWDTCTKQLHPLTTYPNKCTNRKPNTNLTRILFK